MWPAFVVVNAPGLNDLPRFGHPREPMLVEALVAHRAVEALDEGILHRLAWLDEQVLHTMRVGPARQRLACELRSVVGQQPPWVAALGHQPIQNPGDSLAAYRAVHFDGKTLPCVVIHHIERPKLAPVGQLIAHEVHRPALIGRLRRHRFLTSPKAPLALPAHLHLQLLLPVDAVNALRVVSEAFPAQRQG